LPLTYGYAQAINNRNQVLAWYPDPATNGSTSRCWLGSGAGLADLGTCAFASLNNLGQVAFMTSSFAPQPRLYKDGAVTSITLPPEATGTFTAFNDAGQITVDNGGLQVGVLLTPSGPCAADVTGQTAITRGGFRYNRTNQHYTQTMTMKNNGPSTLTGPISVALDNVPATATLFNTSGATSCNPPAGSFYLDFAAASLAPGASVTATIEFINTAGTGIMYDARVLAGLGRR